MCDVKESGETPQMFYRYQQSLIDEATNTLGSLLQHSPGNEGAVVNLTSEAKPSSAEYSLVTGRD